MTPFIYRDPFTAHEVAPELSADEQATVERFGIHEPSAAVPLGGYFGGQAYLDVLADFRDGDGAA